jgi:2-aminoethylphosphonate-pyruvate transaminase
MRQICQAVSRLCTLVESVETEPLDLDRVKEALDEHSDASHVAVVWCETTTGVLNPVPEIAEAVASRDKRLLVDAMSSFGAIEVNASLPFDALAASSNKCLQGSPGLAFVIARESALVETTDHANSLALDLYDQWKNFEKGNGEWRFTPPTHCVLALAEALDEFMEEGGTAGRYERYSANCRTLVEGMRRLGFETLIADDDAQAPIIVTFGMPPDFQFDDFYARLNAKGYIIYPGKVASQPSFRVGCIGCVFPNDIAHFLVIVERTLKEMGRE